MATYARPDTYIDEDIPTYMDTAPPALAPTEYLNLAQSDARYQQIGQPVSVSIPLTQGPAISVQEDTDTDPRLTITPDGVLNFGPGSDVPDTFLRRMGPGSLRTDAAFDVAGQFSALADADITGALSAASASVAGAISAGSAAVTGSLAAGSAAVVGLLTAGSASFGGSLVAELASIAGSLNAGSASVTGAVSAGSASVTGALSAGSASVTGALSAGSASVGSLSVAGPVTAPGGTVTALGWLNAKDFGATGNGTTDDTAAIVAAAAALPSTGGSVYLPPGNYLFNGSSGVTLSTVASVLRGAGAENTRILIGSSFTGTAAVTVTAHSCQVRDLSIAGANSTTTSNPACDAVRVSGCRRTKVVDCQFWNVNGWALNTLASTSSTGNPDGTMYSKLIIRSCAGGIHFLGNTASGYAVNSFVSDVQILQGGVTTGASANLDGIRIEDSWDVLITNVMSWTNVGTGYCLNVVGNCAATFVKNLDSLGPNTGACVIVQDGPNGSPQNVQLNGGVIQQGNIGLSVTGGATQVHVSTMRFINNVTHGVNIAGTGRPVHLHNLYFTTNGTGAAGSNYDINWGGSSTGYIDGCWFGSPIVATGTAGVQQSINVAAGQNVSVLNASFQGTGASSSNWFTNLPGAVLEASSGTFDFATTVNFTGSATALTARNAIAAQPTASGNTVLSVNVGAADPFDRARLLGDGSLHIGSGSAARDTTWQRISASRIGSPDSDIVVGLAGKGLAVTEGSNAKMGTGTLAAGTLTVTNTAVTANSRIYLTIQTPGGTVGSLYVSAKTAGTSFVVKSTSSSDTSTFAYLIVEPS